MLLSRLYRLKLRLQFTGWLQYLPLLSVSLLLILVASLLHAAGWRRAALPFSIAGILLLLRTIFELITIKLGLRPAEPLPRRNDHLDLFDRMRARRSCRSFQLRRLNSADLTELLAYVRSQEDSRGLTAAGVRIDYVAAALTVWPVVNATEFLVAIGPREYDRLAVLEVGRRLQKIVMKATQMGLGTCWIGPGADQKSIIPQLGPRFDPQQDHIICVCAIGYRSAYLPLLVRLMNRLMRRRLPLETLFYADSQFRRSLPVAEFPFDRFGRCYEICQWSPSSFNGQTTRCVAVSGSAATPAVAGTRLPRFDFYTTTSSRYYAAVAVGIWIANWELGCAALGIQGKVAVLSPADRGITDPQDHPPLPRYDASWIPVAGPT